jgi:hypothetical protein
VRIDGNTFLVAGGGSGLGAATTDMLAAAGARVVVADLEGEAPEGGHFVETDVTDEERVRAAVEAAAELGTLRGAVNCAGIASAEKVLGRRRLSDPPRSPRASQERHPRHDHSPWYLRHPDGGRTASRRPRVSRRSGPLPFPSRQAGRVRKPRQTHRGERDAQRRSHKARRCYPEGPEVIATLPGVGRWRIQAG